ncbi:hypothetical protein EVJ50_11580 [Synechococcus sp. RSCCF101]|uniref:hypothetical protein n=1 Tax=Synechococcus sp. RSCCF101 TaxID=2511069 RepID=UPI001245BEA1|nr:hypothetical protein [Synechococcus sp. RSCCF101]QEY32773.1 hypothetical protein EVJ50_11580 [Synechococcus sp. RSCCF101]
MPALSLAQEVENLRNTFPGRRIGGGTRGECAARMLVHLVPDGSVYAPPASGGYLAFLQGPTGTPRPVVVRFSPYQAPGGSQAGWVSTTATSEVDVDASPASLVLLPVPATQGPTVWESFYDCAGEEGDGGGPLGYVQAVSPPALTLLIDSPEPTDRSAAADVAWLASACGSSLRAADVASRFGLKDVLDETWPQNLPVRCTPVSPAP